MTERVRAIVLRRTNYGEADRILQLLTPEGRRAVMARGVRREKSKLAGGIELFAVSDIVINRGKGELGILTSARMVRPPRCSTTRQLRGRSLASLPKVSASAVS